MIYPQDTDSLQLWPRLIHAASIDPILQEALTNLMHQGASLRIQHPDGGLALSHGRTTPEAYAGVREAKLAPRKAKMATVLGTARSAAHPWAQSIMQAYIDLEKRCEKGMTALQKAPGNTTILTALLDRLQLAHLTATALYSAGYQAYWDHASRHIELYFKLHESRPKGMQYRMVGIAWPMQTPDGWLWMVDDPSATCRADLGQGPMERQTDEPCLTYGELGDVITLMEAARTDWTRREAG